MRYIWTALLVVVASTLLAAQQAPPGPPPSIGLPLPPIGLPLPPMSLPPVEQPTGDFGRPRPPRPGGPFRPRQPIVFFGAPYMWGVDYWNQAATPGEMTRGQARDLPQPTNGTLRLDVQPGDRLQVFLDGEFVGTSADFAGELEMAPGSWRVELRAPGYETIAFDVRITAGRTTTYQGALTPVSPPPATTPTPQVGAKPELGSGDTFYLIPGCYLGNVPPHLVKLPAGCDVSKAIVHKPSR